MTDLEESAMAAITAGRQLAEAWRSADVWPSSLDRRKIGELLTALETREPADADMHDALAAMRLYAVRAIDKIRPGFGTLLKRGEYLPEFFGYSCAMDPAIAVFKAIARFEAAQDAYLDRVAVERTIAALGIHA